LMSLHHVNYVENYIHGIKRWFVGWFHNLLLVIRIHKTSNRSIGQQKNANHTWMWEMDSIWMRS
jgi:hypothetical protein